MTARIVTATTSPPDYKPRAADMMSDREIKTKLCFGNCAACKACEVLDYCRYGHEGIRREIK